MQVRPALVQPRHHLILRQGLEVRRLEIQALLLQPGADVLRYELLIQVGRDGQF